VKKASFGKRVVAAILDWIIFVFLGIGSGGALAPLWIVYEMLLVAKWGGCTVGKKVMGIRVVPISGRGEVDLLKAFIRPVAKILSTVFLMLGYLWMLWDDKSQTWHDKIADTFVVEA
jgi:uncharacterized RDD family membrane protein YckC